MSWDSSYAWVVVCKNHRFHHHTNIYFGHKIPLGETDAYSPPPQLDRRFIVRCDHCGQENTYTPKDLFRVELDLPAWFTPHLLFQ